LDFDGGLERGMSRSDGDLDEVEAKFECGCLNWGGVKEAGSLVFAHIELNIISVFNFS